MGGLQDLEDSVVEDVEELVEVGVTELVVHSARAHYPSASVAIVHIGKYDNQSVLGIPKRTCKY